MSTCCICRAKLQHNIEKCPVDAPSVYAPWLLDYSAMHAGDMTHTEHQLVVARWVLYTKGHHSDKVLANDIPTGKIPFGQGIEPNRRPMGIRRDGALQARAREMKLKCISLLLLPAVFIRALR